jgi:hypothetical protein
MKLTTRTLIASEAIREGDPLTCTKVLKADVEGQTFEIGVMKPDNPNGPVGPLGIADRDYAQGEVISCTEMPAIVLPGFEDNESWVDSRKSTPVADIRAIRDAARSYSEPLSDPVSLVHEPHPGTPTLWPTKGMKRLPDGTFRPCLEDETPDCFLLEPLPDHVQRMMAENRRLRIHGYWGGLVASLDGEPD